MMKMICDTDLLSAFAKVNELKLIKKVFPEKKFIISESVFDELLYSLEEGFDFPERIFDMCDITSLKQKEIEMYKRWRKKSKFLTISKADLRTLIIGKSRGIPLLSNDRLLLQFADKEGVLALDIYDIFKLIFKNEILSEEEIRDILTIMEEKDNTRFKDKEKIFV